MATDTKNILSALLFLLFPLPLNRNLVTEVEFIHKHAIIYFSWQTARLYSSSTACYRTLNKKVLNNNVLLLQNRTDGICFVLTTSITDHRIFIFPFLRKYSCYYSCASVCRLCSFSGTIAENWTRFCCIWSLPVCQKKAYGG